ncbi:hypothetical protein FQY83_13330 [Luteimonas marina]|uniref:TonB C-terminal domain-containing protein n=1 Tax=Luteimonas marina TaxID=488485 RepID=A0A5C5U1A7_9GAMM|nr:hypothetical protein [Luteimonas marina]TWT19332.1 hypothetical protein FQY83_13330 [Luteimonas marina]
MNACRSLASGLVIAALAGCASTERAVGKRMILPPSAARMTLEDRQAFLMAVPIEAPLPTYPQDDARGDGMTEVCVEFIVGEQGAVTEATPAYGVDSCAAQPHPAFVAAAVDAVRRWTFFGAAVCEFPEGVERTADCSGEDVVVRPVAIRLMYAFSFERRGGKARVGARPSDD